MFLLNSPKYAIYFGAKETSVSAYFYQKSRDLFVLDTPLSCFYEVWGRQKIYFPKQMHGIDMIQINEQTKESISSFLSPADMMSTQLVDVVLGILTGDCMPVVLYDKKRHAIILVHAGWKGALQGIIGKAISFLCNVYGTSVQDLEAVLGPSAQVCCYQVGQDFVDILTTQQCRPDVLKERLGAFYFDLPLYIEYQLEMSGIDRHLINKLYAVCTICNINFCSYRREKDSAGRQVTAVVLRNV